MATTATEVTASHEPKSQRRPNGALAYSLRVQVVAVLGRDDLEEVGGFSLQPMYAAQLSAAATCGSQPPFSHSHGLATATV